MRLDPEQVTVLRSRAAADAVMAPPPAQYGIISPEVTVSPVYLSLFRLLLGMGLDAEHFGGDSWNPLGALLSPGERVVIKPNLVFHEHYKGGQLHGVVTDPRLIRATADLVFRAIGPEGHLTIGDAPLQSADWAALCERTGLGHLPDFYARRGLRCELRDFRTVESRSHSGLKLNVRRLQGDPEGYRAVNLGSASMHQSQEWRQFRVTNYDPTTMRRHHNAEQHEYLVSGSILAATTVINIAKLKTHRKSGLTGPLKNLVGINGCKDWLPHHTKGSKAEGGDEYSSPATWKRLSTWLVEREETAEVAAAKRSWNTLRRGVWLTGKKLASDHTWEGSWYGNDTLWRTILDLNRAALYADGDGHLQATPQRKFLVLVDALLAGEGEGPMAPSPVPMGVLLGGTNAAALELSATRLAGWPEDRLPAVANSFGAHPLPLGTFNKDCVDVRALEDDGSVLKETSFKSLIRPLAPCAGWRGLFAAERVDTKELAYGR